MFNAPAVPDQYLFITPVWGERYVDRFVKVSLRTQLSAGNLGAVPPGKGRYLIYTRRDDVRAITRSAAYRQLKAIIPVSVRLLDDLPDPRFNSNPHDLQTAAYARGIRAGAGQETAFVFLTPDILLGDGSVRSMVRRVEGGARVVLVAGVRMTTEGAIACVDRHRRLGRAEAPVPARELVRALLDNLHPLSRGHLVGPDGTVHLAQHFYWPVGDDGLHVRGFHHHPLVVWPRNPDAEIRVTIDEEYVDRSCPDRADWSTVTDSDEICVLEFSDRDHKREMLASAPIHCDADIARFMADYTTPAHRQHVLHHVRYHSRDVDPAAWGDVARQSDQLVEKFLRVYRKHQTQGEKSASSVATARTPGGPATVPPPAPRVARFRRVLKGLVRVPYLLLNYPLYQYAGRLNAELISLRTVVEQTRNQLVAVTRDLEALTGRTKPAPLSRPKVTAPDHRS